MSTIKVQNIQHTGSSTNAIALASDGTCTANITNNLSNRNIIINGAMQVNQRGDLTGQTGSIYSLDRFRVAMGSAGTWSLSQSTDTPDGFGSSMKLDCTTANGSLSAGSYMILQQKIEGQNVQGFAKGTSAAKQFAVSFYIKSNVSGTYVAEIQDNDSDRIASKTFTVSDGNWNRYSLIFPADTTGTFDNDNAVSLSFNIWLVAGTTYSSGTLNTSTWAAKVHANRAAGNVNLASSTSNELYITGVQLEVGGVVTDFEHRSFAQELKLCERYFEIVSKDDAYIAIAMCYNSSVGTGVVQCRTTKRTSPSIYQVTGTNYYRFYRNDGYQDFNSFTGLAGIHRNGCAFYNNSLSHTSGHAGGFHGANANAFVALQAEL